MPTEQSGGTDHLSWLQDANRALRKRCDLLEQQNQLLYLLVGLLAVGAARQCTPLQLVAELEQALA